MSLKKRLISAAVIALALGCAVSANAQRTKAPDSVSFERPIQIKIIPSSSPPKAFAVQGNTLWYATDEALIMQPLNARNQTPFQKMGNISTAGITSIVVDPLNRVWAGGDEGVAVRINNNFTSYTAENGLPEGKIQAIAAGPGGQVWVGTENGAARFRDGSWTKFTTEEGLPHNNVKALVFDSKGKLYLGTRRGLAVYDGIKFEVFNARNTGNNGIEWNNIAVLAVEPNRDVIWMTDIVPGGPDNVVYYDGKEWNRYMGIQKGITSIMNDTRRTWFGSEEGVLRFNGEEWVSSANQHGVDAQQVFAMFRDSSGNLWFAMDKGVMQMENPYRR